MICHFEETNLIYSNKRYKVTIGPDKASYEVTNLDNGIVEYSSPVQLEALRMAYMLDVGLETFFKQVDELDKEELAEDPLLFIPPEYIN